MSLFSFDDATFGYRNRTILSKVTCSIEKGDIVGIVGPNGSGKTTFLRTVLGLLPLLQGHKEITPSLRFAYVPQSDELNLYWPLTVEEAVTLSLKSRTAFGKLSLEERQAADEAILTTGIHGIKDQLLSEVSGGQRQKTVLAQALCQRPDILFLDEPTRGLDVVAERDFMNLIETFRKNNALTIVLVTHTLHIPLNFCGKILLFDKGTVITTTPHELVHTNKMEEIYGVPFVHQEHDGLKWVSPQRTKP